MLFTINLRISHRKGPCVLFHRAFSPPLNLLRSVSRSLSTHARIHTWTQQYILSFSHLMLKYCVLQFVLHGENLLLQALRYLHAFRQVVCSQLRFCWHSSAEESATAAAATPMYTPMRQAGANEDAARDSTHTPPPDLRIDFDNAQRATTVAAMRLVPSVRSLRTSVASSLRNRATLRSLANAPRACLSRSLSRFPSSFSTLPPSTLFFPLSLAHGSPKYIRITRARTDTRKADSRPCVAHARTLYTYARSFCTSGSRAYLVQITLGKWTPWLLAAAATRSVYVPSALRLSARDSTNVDHARPPRPSLASFNRRESSPFRW